MYIQDTVYSMENNMFEIYIAGCKKKMINGKLQHCPGCHNYELWEFNNENNINITLDKVNVNLSMFGNIIDYIAILGGDPIDQDIEELKNLIFMLKKYEKNIIIFTGYDIEYIKQFDLDFDYIKCGYYDEHNTTKVYNKTIGLELIGDNQHIYDKNYNIVK